MSRSKSAVLITDAVHELLILGLEEAGFECHYLPDIDPKLVPEIIKAYVGIIINSKITVDRLFLEHASNLKFIARLGSGLEIIDLEAAKEKVVLVHRTPDGNCDAVAEHALGMLLALANNLCTANAEVRNKMWRREELRGWELMGKTIGIIGFGFTGMAFAKRLSGFDVRILAYDKYRKDFANDWPNLLEATIEQIFDDADIISLHLPLTKETRGLVNDEFFDKFKKPVVFINTARGEIAQTRAILNALDSGKLIGACLDVFENEKPKTYSAEQEILFANLFERPNVLLSPHIAGWTHESKRRLSQLLLQRIINEAEMI
jgi:D-3-phosphoglycerate dehydrogenase